MQYFDYTPAPDGYMLYGAGVPAATLGYNGNSYLDSDTGLLWTRTNDTWAINGPNDGWARQITTGNQTFNSTTEADITDITGFTPVANAVYEFEAKLILQSTVATTGPQPSMFVPTGMTDLAYYIIQPTTSYTTVGFQGGGPATNIPAANAPAANVGFLAHIVGVVSVGAAPGAGTVRPRMRTEVAFSNVSTRLGSSFQYRRVV